MKAMNEKMMMMTIEEPPLLGEIAYLKDGAVRHPVIFAHDGWTFCRTPLTVDPLKIIRDEVCKFPLGRKNENVQG
jgi:hypothetical protein